MVSANAIFFLAHLCVLFYVSGAAEGNSNEPGYAYYSEIQGYLKLTKTPADWLAARVNCYAADALLAAPWTDDLLRTINNFLKSNHIDSAVYSGAHITFPEGVYKYVEGEAVLSLKPSDLKSVERCVVFLTEGTLGVVDCKQQLPYVCYSPVPACGDQSLGYEFASRTGHCYKFHEQGMDWLGAHNTCQAEGAHLAVINSDDEAQVLVELLEKHLDSLYSYIKNYIAIGVYYRKPQGAWYTIHDQPLEQAGFAKWHEGAPYDNNYYGFLLRDGTIIDNSTYGTPFICEKKPVLLEAFKQSADFA